MNKDWRRNKTAKLFDEQNGKCCYCDGDTWLAGRETKTQARNRLGFPLGVPGVGKMVICARATLEHLKRRCEGGKNVDNLAMACSACNVRRADSAPDVHRIDMQVLVAAGLHPTNRPRVVDDPQSHIKRGLKALKKLRAGKEIT